MAKKIAAGLPTLEWMYYPHSRKIPTEMMAVVSVFDKAMPQIASAVYKLGSNGVLAIVVPGLADLGFSVERGQAMAVFGKNGSLAKSFHADAHHEIHGIVVEVEAGRGFTNNQFLKDLFQACMMNGVREFAVAMRKDYRGHNDFEKVCLFFDTLYSSNRLQLPLDGVLVIGY